ncbi:hypothetical protein MCOR25_010113 [Pyricularia grisea]|uniref:Transcription initiation factor TFIID subunit 9 n=1 Tax=Pyricularia grisea TaxID=148305 RepID=A0A6P8B944_PYRGI|nr:uncharacterized protein PgNI_04237 [Pyricularia grisea]KAI6351138.1 hypothetical protein MCOR25_010113 [Pyricularia grisea]TLD12167.1 hypothetical protein PgNI_04237 [Pyricularia grisea]
MSTTAPQTNGVPPASGSQPQTQSTNAFSSQQSSSQQPPAAGQPPQAAGAAGASQSQQPQQADSTPAPRPRDARTIELLLTAQGVTAFEPRVPLLLLDFAYRHTAAVLSDALHLAGDPYTTHAGAKPSAAQNATASAPSGGDASVSASAIQVAIASRLAFQFRGAGSTSKEFLLETARERNKAALPRILPHEWGVRLPSERFVLSGNAWGLTDTWGPGEAGIDDDDDDDSEDADAEMRDAMEGVETQGGDQVDEEVGGEPVEGGTVDDVFGDDVDEEMAEE